MFWGVTVSGLDAACTIPRVEFESVFTLGTRMNVFQASCLIAGWLRLLVFGGRLQARASRAIVFAGLIVRVIT